MAATEADLHKLLGKEISTICPHKYVGKNNCAHFVGHALALQLGILCNLSRKKEDGRATIRVDDIYNNLDDTGIWEDRPATTGNQNLLIFVTSASNVDDNDMMNDNPYKHIGIAIGDNVYNYSNHHKKVVSETVKQFFKKCDDDYPQNDVKLFYGVVG
jgi:hypothetical protein